MSGNFQMCVLCSMLRELFKVLFKAGMLCFYQITFSHKRSDVCCHNFFKCLQDFKERDWKYPSFFNSLALIFYYSVLSLMDFLVTTWLRPMFKRIMHESR